MSAVTTNVAMIPIAEPFVLMYWVRKLSAIDYGAARTLERLVALTQMQAPIGVNDLAERLSVKPATLSRMLTSLDEDKLIKRAYPDEDRRACRVSLSTKGRRALEAGLAAYNKALQS